MKFLSILFFCSISFFVFSQDWKTNFEEAKTLAQKEHHNIVLVFQGSDWCAPCMKLEKEIWRTEEYQKLAKDHFVMLKADFPRKKANQLSDEQQKQNGKLAETYNTQGFFPLVLVLTPEGKVLGKLGYEHISPEDYFNKLKAFEK